MIATTDRATCTHPDILPDVAVSIDGDFEREDLIRVIRIETCASCEDRFMATPIFSHEFLRDQFPAETLEASALLAARSLSRFMPHTSRTSAATYRAR